MNEHQILVPRTPWAGPTADELSGEAIELYNGCWVDPPDSPFQYELQVEKTADNTRMFPPLDLHDAGDGHLLMSPRLVEAFGSAGVTNIQFFPAEVVYEPTGIQVPYQVGNILGLVSAVDQKKSDCRVNSDGIVTFLNTIKLDWEVCEPFNLFRLYECFHTIVVSSQVRTTLESSGITGIMWVTQEEWLPSMI